MSTASRFVVVLVMCLLAVNARIQAAQRPTTVPVNIEKITGYTLAKPCSNSSCLYFINSTGSTPYGPSAYDETPYLINLNATSRMQIGYDYAALLAVESSYTYDTFLNSLTDKNTTAQKHIAIFSDYLWDHFYAKYVPAAFLDELKGMEQWCADHAEICEPLKYKPHIVSQRFMAMANMPADTPNLIAGLEREFEKGWPQWLKTIVNDIIKYLVEHYVHTCDSYGVWGSRTQGGRLYTSRNLDYNSNTGINKYKLMQIYNIRNEDGKPIHQYAGFGFAFGLGVLAGQSANGITTSEMNLDNSETTFSGMPFPLRLRYVLENAVDLQSAMTVWNATHNTNSFNFLIGSAKDGQAYALETMFNFTAVFPANSPIEANSYFPCGQPPHIAPTCHKWTWQLNQTTGNVTIGFPLPDAVWRTNHGLNPHIMATQEPLFNNTVFRYMLMHDLFVGFEAANISIGDLEAVGIVASLGIKGDNYLTCDQKMGGDNVLSVAYVPGEKRAFVAWEDGSGSAWRPASCATYLHIDFSEWW